MAPTNLTRECQNGDSTKPDSTPRSLPNTVGFQTNNHNNWQLYPQLPPVIGAPRVCCGHASGTSFPLLLWFGGCATHVTPCSVPGYSYFTLCSEKSEHNCLTNYWYTVIIMTRLICTGTLTRSRSLMSPCCKAVKGVSRKHTGNLFFYCLLMEA